MKPSDKQRPKITSATDRKQFLRVAGAATVGAAALDSMLISKAFGSVRMVQQLPASRTASVLKAAPSMSLHPEHLPVLEGALNKIGLQRVESLATVYKVANQNLTVLPFHPSSKSAQMVGALSLSDGSVMSAVSVKLNGTKVVSYTTHDVINGKLVEKTISASSLGSSGITPYVEKMKRYPVTPGISVETSADISEQTFRKLLADEQSKGQYSAEQVRGFLTNVPTVRLMAQLQYARHKGLKMSKVNACCSTCSCCWGCCSCTSAASSSYLSDKYRSRSRRLGA